MSKFRISEAAKIMQSITFTLLSNASLYGSRSHPNKKIIEELKKVSEEF